MEAELVAITISFLVEKRREVYLGLVTREGLPPTWWSGPWRSSRGTP
jgi:hypothetical protein